MKLKSTICIALVFTANFAAAGIPTFDYANLFQAIIQYTKQLEEYQKQLDQYTRQGKQLSKAKEQFDSITGPRDLSRLLNGPAVKDGRRHIPKNWQETLDLMQGTSDAARHVEAGRTVRGIREVAEVYAPDDLYKDTTTPDAKEHIRQGNQAMTQEGIAQATYNRTTTQMENIEEMMENIDLQNDLKGSIDLQNRIAAEQAILQTELIRIQSLIAMNQAQERVDQHNLRAADVAMSDGTIPVIPE